MPRDYTDADVVEFGRAVGSLMRRARAAAAADELSWTETAVLKRLANEGPATIAELARGEGVRPQSMGTVVASLEEQGLVRRTAHPTDGRQMHVGLTDKGLKVRESRGAATRSWLAAAVATLDDRDRRTLLAAGKIMRKLVEQ